MYFFLYYGVMIKGENMNYIELESVGSVVTNEGEVFPIEQDGCINKTAGMGVNVFETTDEWIENLSSEDLTALISYLDEHIGFDENNPSQILWSYNEWRTQTWNHWETMNNIYMNLEVI